MVADFRPLVPAVIVNDSALVSKYLKVPDELPEAIATEVIVLESAEFLKTPDALDDESVIVVVPDVTVLPKASFLWTVKSPLAVPAVAAAGAVIASCVADPAFTVNDVVAGVNEP